MIPEAYWAVIRRWFWLTLLFAVAGAAAGFYLIPIGLGETSAYDSSATLGVARLVSFSGTVTAGSARAGGSSASIEATQLGTYTSSLAELPETPQFLARLKRALAAEGLFLTEPELTKKIRITASKELFRITVRASADNLQEAELLAQHAADVLMEQGSAEEQRIIDNLTGTMEQQEEALLKRLTTVTQQRIDILNELGAPEATLALQRLMASGGDEDPADLSGQFKEIVVNLAEITGNPQLAFLNSKADALGAELGNLAKARERFSIDLLRWGQPVFVLNPVDTVLTEPARVLRKRDMLILGGGAGLLIGWMAAHAAEHIRIGRNHNRRSKAAEQ